MKTNGMIRILTLRIVPTSIADGAIAGLAIMIASGYHHRRGRAYHFESSLRFHL
jgi:hypothetical protein